MSYTKQTWATGDTVTAEKLNHMESGIESAASGSSGAEVVTIDIDTDYSAFASFMMDEFSTAAMSLMSNAGETMAFMLTPTSGSTAETQLISLVSAVTTARDAGKIVRGVFLGATMDVATSGQSFFAFDINYFPGGGVIRVNVQFDTLTTKNAIITGAYADFQSNS